MVAGDHPRARRLLRELIATYPAAPEVDLALLDLGRLAYRDRDRGAAIEALTKLLARPGDRAIREPAHWLRCQVASGQADELTWLQSFRRAYPTSTHDAEALALSIGVLSDGKRCRETIAAVAEYLELYPHGAFAEQARARSQRCEP